MQQRPGAKVRSVVGAGQTELLLTFALPFPKPVAEIIQVSKTVLVDRLDPTRGSVLLQGRLRACYLYVAGRLTAPPPIPLPDQTLTYARGPVEALITETGWARHIPVGAAEPDMDARMVEAYTADQALTVTETDPGGLILALADHSVLRLAVQVSTASPQYAPHRSVIPAGPGRPVFARFQANQ